MHIFKRVTRQTPESIELEFTLAGIGSRAWASLIDYHVLGLLLVVFLIGWSILSIHLIDIWNSFFKNQQIGLWLVAIALLAVFFVYTGYFVFFETLWRGQTPGKRFAKIRVVRDDGRLIGIQQATLRSLLRVFDDILFLGVFLIILNTQEKRLGDWAAGTIVIQLEPQVAAAAFLVSEQAQSLAQQLVHKADLSQLLPDDFAVIREYLQRRRAMSLRARAQVSLRLVEQVQGIVTLEKLPAAVSADIFLEAVYTAYQQSFEF